MHSETEEEDSQIEDVESKEETIANQPEEDTDVSEEDVSDDDDDVMMMMMMMLMMMTRTSHGLKMFGKNCGGKQVLQMRDFFKYTRKLLCLQNPLNEMRPI